MTYSAAIYRPLAEADPPVHLATYAAGAAGSPLTEVTIAAAAPLGYTQATLTLAPGARKLVPEGAHVEITWNGSPCWEVIRRRSAYQGRDQRTVELAGYAGFALDVNPWSTATFKVDSEQTYGVGLILAQALAQATAPKITAGQPWSLPDVNLTFSELDGRTPQQIAVQVQSLTNYDMLVFDGRRAVLVPRLVSGDGAQYEINPDDLNSYEVDDGDRITRVTATYTDPVTGVKARTAQFPDRQDELEYAVGFVRSVVRDAGTVSLEGAEAFAQAERARGIRSTIRASVGPMAALRELYGGTRDGPLVKPGEWVQFEDPDQEEGTLIQLPIVATACDSKGNVTATLGERPLNVATNLAALGKSANAYARGTNPLSGAPK